jgi:hypothetical protein
MKIKLILVVSNDNFFRGIKSFAFTFYRVFRGAFTAFGHIIKAQDHVL